MFTMEEVQRYMWILNPFRVLGSPAPHIVARTWKQQRKNKITQNRNCIISIPANTRSWLLYCWADVVDGGPNIETTLGQCLVFAGISLAYCMCGSDWPQYMYLLVKRFKIHVRAFAVYVHFFKQLYSVSVYYVAVCTIVLSRHGSNLARPVIIHDIIHGLIYVPSVLHSLNLRHIHPVLL